MRIGLVGRRCLRCGLCRLHEPLTYLRRSNNYSRLCRSKLFPLRMESLRTELHLRFPLLRITELTNPFNIPFHNSAVLGPAHGQLYEYIWQILKKNHTNTFTELESPIIANLDGQISTLVHHALERFVKCSSNTVQFTMCYNTINEDLKGQLEESVSMGPGAVIYNLIRRNCPDLKNYEYSSLTTIEKYNDDHEIKT